MNTILSALDHSALDHTALHVTMVTPAMDHTAMDHTAMDHTAMDHTVVTMATMVATTAMLICQFGLMATILAGDGTQPTLLTPISGIRVLMLPMVCIKHTLQRKYTFHLVLGVMLVGTVGTVGTVATVGTVCTTVADTNQTAEVTVGM